MANYLPTYYSGLREMRERALIETAKRIEGDPIRQRIRRLGCCHADECTHPSCQCDVVAVTELARLKASL